MTVPTENKTMAQILFWVAKDYLKLSNLAKANIGRELKLLDDMDIFSKTEDEIDELIFHGIGTKGLAIEFSNLVYKAHE